MWYINKSGWLEPAVCKFCNYFSNMGFSGFIFYQCTYRLGVSLLSCSYRSEEEICVECSSRLRRVRSRSLGVYQHNFAEISLKFLQSNGCEIFRFGNFYEGFRNKSKAKGFNILIRISGNILRGFLATICLSFSICWLGFCFSVKFQFFYRENPFLLPCCCHRFSTPVFFLPLLKLLSKP